MAAQRGLGASVAMDDACEAALAGDSEGELKSAAVWRFVQYSHLEPGVDGAITGVLGRSAFGQALRRTRAGKSTGGHPMRVVDAKSDMRCCRIVYLATNKSEEIRRAPQTTQPLRALTIGESDRFLDIRVRYITGFVDLEHLLQNDRLAAENRILEATS